MALLSSPGISGCHDWRGGGCWRPVGRGRGATHTLQCTGRPPPITTGVTRPQRQWGQGEALGETLIFTKEGQCALGSPFDLEHMAPAQSSRCTRVCSPLGRPQGEMGFLAPRQRGIHVPAQTQALGALSTEMGLVRALMGRADGVASWEASRLGPGLAGCGR